MNKKNRLKRIIDDLREIDPDNLEIQAALKILDEKHQTMDEGDPEGPEEPGGNHPVKPPPIP